MGYKNIEQRREYQKNWVAARRAKFFKNKKCAMADETCEGALQLDHKDPAKKWKHRIWSYSWAVIRRETRKCQVLCSSHHFRKTAADVRAMRERAHGTMEGYEKWHCRCDRCARFAFKAESEYEAGISLDAAKALA